MSLSRNFILLNNNGSRHAVISTSVPYYRTAHLRLTAIFVSACRFGLKLFGASWGLQLPRTLRFLRRAPARFALSYVLRLVFALRLASAALRLTMASHGMLVKTVTPEAHALLSKICEACRTGEHEKKVMTMAREAVEVLVKAGLATKMQLPNECVASLASFPALELRSIECRLTVDR